MWGGFFAEKTDSLTYGLNLPPNADADRGMAGVTARFLGNPRLQPDRKMQ